MSIAARVRGALAIFVTILLAVLALGVLDAERAADRARQVREAALRSSAGSGAHRMRLAELRATEAKYRVTRDSGYLARFGALVREHTAALRTLRAGATGAAERSLLDSLDATWRIIEVAARGRRADPPGFPGLDAALARMVALTERMADASRGVLEANLVAGERAAARARAVAWWTATLASLAAIALAALLARAVTRPLDRLSQAARDVAAGRFSTRIHASPSARDEIADVARAFDEMVARLEQLDRARHDVISGVSHDLKAPLASMQATTDALLDGLGGPLTARQERLLLLSRQSGRRLSAMIGKLLDLARFDPRSPHPPRVPFDLVALARDAAERARPAHVQRGVSIAPAPAAGSVPVCGDPDAMTRLLENLLENAIRVSPPEGRVEIRVEVRDGKACLEVADEGPGVPDAEKELVFQRFRQGASGRAAAGGEGVGLGLAICRQVAAMHHGVIRVRDNRPHGAVFTLELAVAEASSGIRMRGEAA